MSDFESIWTAEMVRFITRELRDGCVEDLRVYRKTLRLYLASLPSLEMYGDVLMERGTTLLVLTRLDRAIVRIEGDCNERR